MKLISQWSQQIKFRIDSVVYFFPLDTDYATLCITEIEKLYADDQKVKMGKHKCRKEKSPLSLGYFDSSPRKLKGLTSSLDEIDVFVL